MLAAAAVLCAWPTFAAWRSAPDGPGLFYEDEQLEDCHTWHLKAEPENGRPCLDRWFLVRRYRDAAECDGAKARYEARQSGEFSGAAEWRCAVLRPPDADDDAPPQGGRRYDGP